MYKGKTILGLITARGNSKGIPGKNIKLLGGKPLISWTIEEAKKSRYIDRLILSSEDHEIINIAEKEGCEIPFVRPFELARDESSSMSVIIHAIEYLKIKYDYLVLLQPTSPFRKVKHIDDMIEECFFSNSRMMVSVSKMKKYPAYIFSFKGKYLESFIKIGKQLRRQDMPVVYEHNGAIYLAKIEYLLSVKSFLVYDAMGYIMEPIPSLDIDDYLDWKYAEFLVEKKLVDG